MHIGLVLILQVAETNNLYNTGFMQEKWFPICDRITFIMDHSASEGIDQKLKSCSLTKTFLL